MYSMYAACPLTLTLIVPIEVGRAVPVIEGVQSVAAWSVKPAPTIETHVLSHPCDVIHTGHLIEHALQDGEVFVVVGIGDPGCSYQRHGEIGIQVGPQISVERAFVRWRLHAAFHRDEIAEGDGFHRRMGIRHHARDEGPERRIERNRRVFQNERLDRDGGDPLGNARQVAARGRGEGRTRVGGLLGTSGVSIALGDDLAVVAERIGVAHHERLDVRREIVIEIRSVGIGRNARQNQPAGRRLLRGRLQGSPVEIPDKLSRGDLISPIPDHIAADEVVAQAKQR